jgi:hypothetical protein
MNSNEEVLTLIYQIKDNLVWEVSDDQVVSILEKQYHWIQRFFRKIGLKIPVYKRVKLDGFGSFIFLQIDGKRTVEEIGHLLDEKYGEEAHPLYERLLLFLNYIDTTAEYIERIS